ncbi:MAG: hypothetical protein ACOCXV_00575 [Bacteroidota bacterium]
MLKFRRCFDKCYSELAELHNDQVMFLRQPLVYCTWLKITRLARKSTARKYPSFSHLRRHTHITGAG